MLTTNLAAAIDTLKRELEDMPLNDARQRLEEMRRCINFVHGRVQSLESHVDKFRIEAVRMNQFSIGIESCTTLALFEEVLFT